MGSAPAPVAAIQPGYARIIIEVARPSCVPYPAGVEVACHQSGGRGWSWSQTMILWCPQSKSQFSHKPIGKPTPKDDAKAAVIINLVRLINRHINHLRVSRNNFNFAAVINHLFLRCGLQIADIVADWRNRWMESITSCG